MSRKQSAVTVRSLLSSLTLVLLTFAVGLSRPAVCQDVLTYHNNNARTGLDTQETKLTLGNVNSSTFGLLFKLPADGLVDAEPLYISSLTVKGAKHNVAIVATENDSVYAYDADTGAALWSVRTLKPGETASDDRGCSQITPKIGISATPVIYRPKTGNPVIYVLAMSKDSSKNYHQRLHALDATNGAELLGGPVDIAAKYPGTGDNSSNGYVILDPSQYKERAGLLMIGGTVYLSWASHCDFRPYTAGSWATTRARCNRRHCSISHPTGMRERSGARAQAWPRTAVATSSCSMRMACLIRT